MKLNYKRTIFVGFAFFLISAFWQVYDSIIPLTLTNKFGLSQTGSGFVMVLDNLIALFMLPLFGAISDRCRSRLGKRTPFILIGTIAAAILFFSLSFADNAQLKSIGKLSKLDNPETLQTVYTEQSGKTLKTPEGREFRVDELFTEDEFVSITSKLEKKDGKLYRPDGTEYTLSFDDQGEQNMVERAKEGKTFTNPHYKDFVAPAQQASTWNVTKSNSAPLIIFLGILFLLLIAMATFRSPAVALMPDVTIKPLRSKANAIINLMGSAGGILVLGLGMALATSDTANTFMSYTLFFGIVSAVMLIALALFRLLVKEPKFAREMQEESKRFGITEDEPEQKSGGKRMGRAEFRSLCFLLASVALWYMGYNAVTSKYSVYANRVLNQDYNLTLIIAQAAAIISYIPIGILSSHLGRKKTILIGVLLLLFAFGSAYFMHAGSSILIMYLLFAIAGIGWATINVNSFPMVVEMSKSGDVGRYTGFYYTASMAAQAVTPWLCGIFMDHIAWTALFPYAAVFVALAFVTMIFVRHGDNKPIAKTGLEALNVED
ncbi:MAG: MFS transporter [Oscillospiraceae bacterium]|nr:MFS transporter [Oscillospiraceae bacterium]